MSIDHDANLIIGCYVYADGFEAMMKCAPEKTQMQPRFDNRTGKRVEDERVIIEYERNTFVFKGEVFEAYDDGDDTFPCENLFEAVCAEIKCSWQQVPVYEQNHFFFQAIKSCVKDNQAPIVIPERERKELARIHKELKKLKIKVDPPRIHAVLSIA